MAAKLQPVPDPQYVDEHHQRISEFADAYFDEDADEREAFVTELMQRRGYTPKTRTEWEPPAPPEPAPAGAPAGPGARPKPAYFKR